MSPGVTLLSSIPALPPTGLSLGKLLDLSGLQFPSRKTRCDNDSGFLMGLLCVWGAVNKKL